MMVDADGVGAPAVPVPASYDASVDWLQQQITTIKAMPINNRAKKDLINNAINVQKAKQMQALGRPPPQQPRQPRVAAPPPFMHQPQVETQANVQDFYTGSWSGDTHTLSEQRTAPPEGIDKLNFKKTCTEVFARGSFTSLAAMLTMTKTKHGTVPGAQHYGQAPLPTHKRPGGNGHGAIDSATIRSWAFQGFDDGERPLYVIVVKLPDSLQGEARIPPGQRHFGLQEFCHPPQLRTDDGEGGPAKIKKLLEEKGIVLVPPRREGLSRSHGASEPVTPEPVAAAPKVEATDRTKRTESRAAKAARANTTSAVAGSVPSSEPAATPLRAVAPKEHGLHPAADQNWATVRYVVLDCITAHCIVSDCIMQYRTVSRSITSYVVVTDCIGRLYGCIALYHSALHCI